MKSWILLILLFTGCAYRSASLLPPQVSEPAPIGDRYVFILLLDGARPGEIDQAVDQGLMPNLKRLFYEEGARFENALTVFPTVSTPAHQALLSGLQPGHHGIPNLDWFSRPLEKYIDYLHPMYWSWTNLFMFNSLQVFEDRIRDDRPALIFETLRGHPSLAVYETANSGATSVLPSLPPILTGYKGKFQGFYEVFDAKALNAVLQRFKKDPPENLPRFTMAVCYGMDLVNHYVHPQSERAQDLLRLYDRFLGEFERTLKDRGIFDKTLLVVTSDHGQHDVDGGMVDLGAYLHQIGLRADLANPKKSQVMWGDHGVTFSNLYFKLGDDWTRRPSYRELRDYTAADGKRIDLVERLLAHPDIEWLVTAEGLGKTHIHRDGQHALILRKKVGDEILYSYQPDPGQDPLDYLGDPLLRSWSDKREYHDAEAWLKATGHLAIPDAVVAIPQLFDDFRIGDLILMTSKRTQFHDPRPSGHGSIWREDRHIPLMFHGPGIRAGLLPYARIVDVYPTLMAYYGLQSPGPVDGQVRLGLFSEADRKEFAAVESEGEGGLSRQAWEEELRSKLGSGKLSAAEEEKAKVLLDGLEALKAAGGPL
ncbi:MAG TPA: alkaline phosphatase family protein [bacterium]|nr:alkaline phosphatase family protein [bacterium]